MIDWIALLFNSFWILGTAVLLAAFSYHYWLAQVEGTSVRVQLERPSFSRPFWFGFVLISLGLMGTSSRWWETAVWGLFTALSLFNFYTTFKQKETT